MAATELARRVAAKRNPAGPASAHTDEEEYEIEKIKSEIVQEQQMKEMLEKSSVELKQTIDQLEKRIDGIDLEGNEWKTRFETQEEINYQLERQILLLQERATTIKQSLNKMKKSPSNEFEETVEPALFTVQNLRKQQSNLENQIRDLEWRLEQESKAYHKANDERKQYMAEINTANFALDNMLKKSQLESQTEPSKSRNIPENQRVLDPRKGPIKKTAAVKALPKLDGDEGY